MSKVNLEMDSGNFSLAFAIQLSPEVTAGLIEKGLKYEVERGVLSKTYLALAGVDGKRAGTKVLPAGYKRESLPFNEENAQAFKSALLAQLEGLGTVENITVSQWTPSVAESKYVEEKAAMLRHEQAGDLEEWLSGKIGYTGPTHTEDGEDYAPTALAAIRAYVDKLRKAL